MAIAAAASLSISKTWTFTGLDRFVLATFSGMPLVERLERVAIIHGKILGHGIVGINVHDQVR